jgi:hypothetical protein
MKREEFRDLVLKVLEKFKNREYKCWDISICISDLVRELNEELGRNTNGFCFVETHGEHTIIIACGLLETYFVTLDYDVEEIVKVVEFRVE